MQCNQCLKIQELCVCSLIQPQKTNTHILILQHPQEPDKDLGTARLSHLALPHSTLKVGLSWPNLRTALGKETAPSHWGVLYLGSGIKSEKVNLPPHPLQWVTKGGIPSPPPKHLEGIVILDGTWSQAKALWWRNPWLLKLHRGILQPTQRSLYRNLRKEPRRECLSTIESIAETLQALKEDPHVSETLKSLFSALLERAVLYRKNRKNHT